MWVRFAADFDFRPPGAHWTTAYKAGMRVNVTRDCARAAGERAVRVRTPSKAAAAQLALDPCWSGDRHGA